MQNCYKFQPREVQQILNFTTAGEKIEENIRKYVFSAGPQYLTCNVKDVALWSKPFTSTVSVLVRTDPQKRPQKELELIEKSLNGKRSSFLVGNVVRALQMVERIRAMFSALGYDFKPEFDSDGKLNPDALRGYSHTLLRWYVLYNLNMAEKVAKYLSTTAFNYIIGDSSLPKLVLPWNFKEGHLSANRRQNNFQFRLIKQLRKHYELRTMTRANWTDAQSFLYFKKGCPRVSKDFLQEGIKKHFKAMTQVAPKVKRLLSDRTHDPEYVYKEPLKERVKKIVKEVFKHRNNHHIDYWWSPSTSSCMTSSRSTLGNVPKVHPSFSGGQYVEVPGSIAPLRAVPDHSRPYIFRHESLIDGKITERVEYRLKYIPDTAHITILFVADITIGLDDITNRIRAIPIALSEPLKVRVITKGESYVNYALKGAQKMMWEALKEHKWFKLIGRPPSVMDIPDITLRGGSWISVDYSEATDRLNKYLSQLVLKEICKYLDLPYDFCKESLTGHMIEYHKEKCDHKKCVPEEIVLKEGVYMRRGAEIDIKEIFTSVFEKKDGCFSVMQGNGQLMGENLSFPILCLANATIISLALQPSEFKPEDLDFLVNGDDGLFRGGEEEYKRWSQYSSQVGLAPSMGKVYKSDQFCVINSQLFSLSETENTIEKVDYPNFSGLSLYDAKSADRLKPVLSLSSSYSDWMNGFQYMPLENQMAAQKLWYDTLKPILQHHQVKDLDLSYHLDTSLGGLGLPLRFGDVSYDTLSIKQLLRARCLVQRARERGRVELLLSDGSKHPSYILDDKYRVRFDQCRIASADRGPMSLDDWIILSNRIPNDVHSGVMPLMFDIALNRGDFLERYQRGAEGLKIGPMDVIAPKNIKKLRVSMKRYRIGKFFDRKSKHPERFNLSNYTGVQLITCRQRFTYAARIPCDPNQPFTSGYRAWLDKIVASRLVRG